MHFANQESVPVQSPRHAAMLGRTYPIPDAEFKSLWLSKFDPVSAAPAAPKYPTEADEIRKTAKASGGGPVVDEPATKEAGRKAFLALVDKLIAQGHEYSAAWSI